MCRLVCFTFQIFLDRVVLPLVRKYEMELLCLITTYIRPKHKAVRSVTAKFLLVDITRHKFDVSTATFNILLNL
uniref:Uncharacterized protein n=1 Tax=Arundo donax TaxID=35708 RepID=A0A0A9F3I7_ARUDO